jgi:hypothetical protein
MRFIIQIRLGKGSVGRRLCLANEGVCVYRDLRFARFVTSGREGLPVQLDKRSEAFVGATDDRDRQWQSESAGADHRLGRATDRDPHWQRVLHWSGPDAGVVQRCTMAS